MSNSPPVKKRTSKSPKSPPSSGVIAKIKKTPKKDLSLKQTKAKTSSSSYYGLLSKGKVVALTPLPKLVDTGQNLREQQFKAKLEQCGTVFDFSDPLSDIVSKDVKRDTLIELIEYVSTQPNAVNESLYGDIVTMISNNLFRDLPPKLNPLGDNVDPEEDEPVLEAAWPHLQLIYEFLIRFLESSDFKPKKAKNFFTKEFVSNLLQLFDSEDPRERDYLKTTLHRIYGKFLHLRPFIRKEIGDLFVTFVFETEKFNGISEILEILGAIINGFSVPLKQEHRDYLIHNMLPLLRIKHINGYHAQLFYCISQFLEKDTELVEAVILYMLKIWPITNSVKQTLFIVALDEFINFVDPQIFENIQIPLFKRLKKCISDTHFQVSEKTMLLFQNETFLELFAQNSEVLIPYIYPAVVEVSRSYWNENCQTIALEVLKLFNQINSEVVEECASKNVNQSNIQSLIKKQNQIFDKIESSTTKKPATPLPSLYLTPQKSSHTELLEKETLPLPEKTYEALQKHIEKTATPSKKKKKSKK